MVNFGYISTNGIRLHTALAGPEDGDPIVLLHGFPEAWFGWEAQIGPLADAGFRVIAPDQRGYNLSDKPRGVSSYRMEALVDDILGLAALFPQVELEPERAPLSAEEIELIADHVIARLSSEVIEGVAWEVVPDIAEKVVREEIDKHDEH